MPAPTDTPARVRPAKASAAKAGPAKASAAKAGAAKAGAAKAGAPRIKAAPKAVLTISSKNYSSWSLRGYLLCRMAGIDFEEARVSADDPSIRAELLLQSSSFLVPRLDHEGMRIWDTLAIAEYLNELFPEAGLLPKDRAARAHCRAISGEMHSGFANLRSALPMSLKAHHPGFKVWAGAQGDILRIVAIWRECLKTYGGPYLFGTAPTVADAMYAPVCTRFRTYDVPLEPVSAAYCQTMLAFAPLRDWTAQALVEPDEMEELDVEF
ncbi:glutathione S-transferase family protein [Ancylobacter radicis]|uniref:Glutathione S-transferase family protein n=1 Tax=Ancylobacter radicis TaxID=2836179 RepID=A0ABS5R6W3_9HYPH|nr:glutathione S-transferase family protein [Ancylobacter radicis]MBS9477411.1 glutathione S-transferase family protein [Ancylobacter radicis]